MGLCLLIMGSRTVTSVHELFWALDQWGEEDKVTMVITGEAEGADELGRQWALTKNIAYQGFPAKWDEIPDDALPHQIGYGRHGRYYKPAGPIRNKRMVDVLVSLRERGEEVAVICLMEVGGSKGSMGMLGLLREAGIKPFVKECRV